MSVAKCAVVSSGRDCNMAESEFRASSCLSVCRHGTSRLPAGRIFVESDIRSFFFFPKSVQRIHVSLISDMNYGYFMCRPVYGYDLLSSSKKEKCFIQKL